jgi:uncharacterized membrane protein
MTDRIIAILALLAFALSISVVPYFVPDLDLIIVIVLCVGFAAYDFWRELSRPKNGG